MQFAAIKARIEAYAKGDADDIVGLYQIIGWLEQEYRIHDMQELIAATLEFVKNVLNAGFQAGEFEENGVRFELWENQAPEYVCARIKEEWLKLGKKPTIADIVWFGLPQYKYD